MDTYNKVVEALDKTHYALKNKDELYLKYMGDFIDALKQLTNDTYKERYKHYSLNLILDVFRWTKTENITPDMLYIIRECIYTIINSAGHPGIFNSTYTDVRHYGFNIYSTDKDSNNG